MKSICNNAMSGLCKAKPYECNHAYEHAFVESRCSGLCDFNSGRCISAERQIVRRGLHAYNKQSPKSGRSHQRCMYSLNGKRGYHKKCSTCYPRYANFKAA